MITIMPFPLSFPMSSIRIIYASTGGHAKYVANRLTEALIKASASESVMIDTQSASQCRRRDLIDADVLILVSAEIPGQQHLNQNMHALLFDRAKRVDLDGRRVACVALSGDEETAEILGKKFQAFIDAHNGTLFVPHLLLTGKDLYAYDKEMERWADKLLTHILHRLQPAHVRKKAGIPV